jgi:hypothetical protein
MTQTAQTPAGIVLAYRPFTVAGTDYMTHADARAALGWTGKKSTHHSPRLVRTAPGTRPAGVTVASVLAVLAQDGQGAHGFAGMHRAVNRGTRAPFVGHAKASDSDKARPMRG